jgi:hypothetical protein
MVGSVFPATYEPVLISPMQPEQIVLRSPFMSKALSDCDHRSNVTANAVSSVLIIRALARANRVRGPVGNSEHVSHCPRCNRLLTLVISRQPSEQYCESTGSYLSSYLY